MSSLLTRTPAATVGDLLNVENGGSGITPTGQLVVQDGLGNPTALSVGASGNGATINGNLVVTGTISGTSIVGLQASISPTLDGGGLAIQPGIEMDLVVPFNCTLNSVILLADQTGSILLDIQKCILSSYPPSSGNTICSTTKPTIISAQYYQDAALASWTTTFNKNDVIRVTVLSCATITRLSVNMLVTKF